MASPTRNTHIGPAYGNSIGSRPSFTSVACQRQVQVYQEIVNLYVNLLYVTLVVAKRLTRSTFSLNSTDLKTSLLNPFVHRTTTRAYQNGARCC